MNRLARFSLVVLIALLIVLAVAAVAAVVSVRRPFPQTTGSIPVTGLEDEVEILRDRYGVPHIYAQNQDDLFFAQGYVHAQDRFWQMEFWRHTGQGRLSEMVGEATLDSDIFIRTLGWNRMAANTVNYYAREAPEFMRILEAYSAGVNAYLEENRESLSLNYTILNLVQDPWEVERWQPIDTVSWGVVMSDVLSRDMFNEIRRAKLIGEFGEEKVQAWNPFYPYHNRPVIAPTDELLNAGTSQASKGDIAEAIDWSRVNLEVIGKAPDMLLFGGGPFVGSNNWVVSGEHTETGLPLLANDPHLEIQMPSIWYEVGLHAPGWDVAGFSFAGVPGIIIGHNERIAWGVTNAGTDVQDLFIERINPDDPNQYEFMGEWEEMQVIPELIKVNGGEDVTIDVRLTRHGPIISELSGVVEQRGQQDDLLAAQWTAMEPSRVLQSVILLNQASGYQDFREALRYWDVPGQNFVYADVEGNIAYQLPGLVPIRKKGDGLIPVPGWTGEYEWEGWVPYEDLPALFNPEKGYIVTANHAIVDEAYPYFLKHYWDNGNRGQRIVDLMEEELATGSISADDFARMQFDSKSLTAETFIPLLSGLSSNDAQVQAVIDRLTAWDLQERRDSVPAALFEIFFMHLVRNVLLDDVGEEYFDQVANTDPALVFMLDLAQERDALWWDDVTTPTPETADEILIKSLAETVAWFETNVEGEMEEWTWGTIHTATFVSNPVGASGIGLLEGIVNRGPFPADGGVNIVNAMSWDWSDPAKVNWHPSMRMIVDMSDLDASRSVHPTGQSGHPYHEHYDDMIQLWLNGEYHPMHFSQDAVRSVAEDILMLRPEE